MLTFDKFKQKLEDVTLQAINSGDIGLITASFYNSACCKCPLACHPLAQSYKPIASAAAEAWNIKQDQAATFIIGFESHLNYGLRRNKEWFDLGQKFRAKWIELHRKAGQ